MAYSQTWNAAYEAAPADTDNVSAGAEEIRDLKTDIRERMAKDHYMAIAGTDADHGEHSKVTFQAQSADPAPGANKGALYTKDAADADSNDWAELHYQDEQDNVIQITRDGGLFGDKARVEYDPANYDPTISGLADAVTMLTAHLKGIDVAIGANTIERGCVLSNNTTDANNDIDITAGLRLDVGYAAYMVNSALTKRLDAAWAVGTNQGGIDAGSKANNTWYHVWIIKRPDTGVVDALFSTSPTAPTMPANYTLKSRIGSIRTNGSGNIIAFKQNRNRVIWDVPILDQAAALGNTTANLITLSVPTGIAIDAMFRAACSANFNSTLISSPGITDTAGASTTAPLFNVTGGIYVELTVTTDTSARVRARAATGSETLYIATTGWIEPGARMV